MVNDQQTPVQPAEAVQAVTVHAVVKSCAWLRWAKGLGYFAVLLLSFLVALMGTWIAMPPRPYATLVTDGESSCQFFFSPDASRIATRPDRVPTHVMRTVQVWDIEHAAQRFSTITGGRENEPLSFSPDSRLLAASTLAGEIVIWNSKSGNVVTTIKTQKKDGGVVSGVDFRFSPDSRFLVFADQRNGWQGKYLSTFWNIEDGREQGTIEGDVSTLVFAPHRAVVASYIHKRFENKTKIALDYRPQCRASIGQGDFLFRLPGVCFTRFNYGCCWPRISGRAERS